MIQGYIVQVLAAVQGFILVYTILTKQASDETDSTRLLQEEDQANEDNSSSNENVTTTIIVSSI